MERGGWREEDRGRRMEGEGWREEDGGRDIMRRLRMEYVWRGGRENGECGRRG